jgi:integrase
MGIILFRIRDDVPPVTRALPLTGDTMSNGAAQIRTIEDVFTFYKQAYLPQQASNTQYQKSLLFRMFRKEFAALPLSAVTPDRLREWRNRLQKRLAPDTVRNYMDIFSTVLTVGVEIGWLPEQLVCRVRKPPTSPGRVRYPDTDEQARLLAACQGSRRCAMLYLLVLLAISTGMRKMEMLRLTWHDVDLERGMVRLIRTKNKEHRAVPLPQITIEALRSWQEQDPSTWLFPSRTGLQPADVSRAWYLALAKAGIEDFRFHDLRHTAASYLAMSGVELEDVGEILGHRDLQTTRQYRHLTIAYTAGLVENMAQRFVRPYQGNEGGSHAEQ